eukprot:gene26395-31893_t
MVSGAMTLLEVVPDEILAAVCSHWLSLADISRLDQAATSSEKTRDIILTVFRSTSIDLAAFSKQGYPYDDDELRRVSNENFWDFCDWVSTKKFQLRNGLNANVEYFNNLEKQAVTKIIKREPFSFRDAGAGPYEFVHKLETNWFDEDEDEYLAVPPIDKLRFIAANFTCIKELDLSETLVSESLLCSFGGFVPVHMPQLTRITCELEIDPSFATHSAKVMEVLGPRIICIRNRFYGDRAVLRYCPNLEKFSATTLEDYELLPRFPNLRALLLSSDDFENFDDEVTEAHLASVLQLKKLEKITIQPNLLSVDLQRYLVEGMPHVKEIHNEIISIKREEGNSGVKIFIAYFPEGPEKWNALLASLPPIKSLTLPTEDAVGVLEAGYVAPHMGHLQTLILGRSLVKACPGLLQHILSSSSGVSALHCESYLLEDSCIVNKQDRAIFFREFFQRAAAHVKVLELDGLGHLSEKEVQQIVSKCPSLTDLRFKMTKRCSPDSVLKTLASKGIVWDSLGLYFIGLDDVVEGMAKYGLKMKKLTCNDISCEYSSGWTRIARYGHGAVPVNVETLRGEVLRLKQLKAEKAEQKAQAKLKSAEKKAKKLEAKLTRDGKK